jgi:hypothetical protein
MTDYIRIKLDDSEFMRFAEQFPRAVYNAQRSAHRKTATWARKKLDIELAQDYDVGKKVFYNPRKQKPDYKSGKRGEMRNSSSNSRKKKSDFFSTVTSGSNPLPFKASADNSFVGKLTQLQSGAKAGSHFVEKGFVATMRNSSNITAIFKRTGGHTASRVMLRPSKKYPNGRLSTKQFKAKIAMEYLPLEKTNTKMNAIESIVSAKFKDNFETKMSEYIARGIIVDDTQTGLD